MSITSIDYTFDFDDCNNGLSGTIAVLNPRTENPQQAVLIFSKYFNVKSGKALELTANNGIWHLSIPTEKGDIIFSPQLNCLTITENSCDESHKISLKNK